MMPIVDEALIGSSGLPADALRKLVDAGMLSPSNPGETGRGKRRQWSRESVVFAARVVACRNGGFSLLTAAAVLSLLDDDFATQSGARFPSIVSSPKGEADFNKVLKLSPKAQSSDLRLDVIEGRNIFRRRGVGAPELIAQVAGARVLAPTERREGVVKSFGKAAVENLPLDFTTLSRARIADGDHHVTKTTINLELAAKIVIRELLRHQGFVAT